jgi:hypothetical protein
LSSDVYGSYQATSASDGSFTFPNIWSGTYTLSAVKAGYCITPSSTTVTVLNGDVIVPTFTACYTWSSTYSSAYDQKAAAIISDGAGGFLIAGSVTTTLGCYGYIAHFDALGNHLWDHQYGGSYYNTFSSICAVSNHEYVATGTTISTTTGYNDLLVVKIKSDGTLDSTFGSSGILDLPLTDTGGTSEDGAGASVIAASSGNYVIAGTVTNISQLSNFYVCEITPSGVVNTSQTYGVINWQSAFGLCESFTSGMSDGYVIVGTRQPTVGKNSIDVLKISNWQLKWEQVIDGINGNAEARGVSMLQDGRIAVTGYTTTTSSLIWTGLFSHDGSLTKTILLGGSSSNCGATVLPLSSGGFLISATSVNTDQNRGDTDYYLASCDTNGTLLWQMLYDRGAKNNDTCVGVLPVCDGYVLGGYSYADTNNVLWLLKVSQDGQYEAQ